MTMITTGTGRLKYLSLMRADAYSCTVQASSITQAVVADSL
jgi:hypothetical protein